MKYALAFLLVIATICCTTAASAACLTMKQARAANQTAHLKYKIAADRRCWYAVKSSRGGVESRRHAECPQECSRTPPPQGRGRLSGQALIAGVAPGPRETNHAGEGMHQRPTGPLASDEQNLRKLPSGGPAPDQDEFSSQLCEFRPDENSSLTENGDRATINPDLVTGARATEKWRGRDTCRNGVTARRDGNQINRVADTFMLMTAQPWHHDLWLKIQIGWLLAGRL